MSTLLPPPKRQKSAYSQSLKPPEATPEPERIPEITIQFVSADDNSPLGPPMRVPADMPRNALQALVNEIKGDVSGIKVCRPRVSADALCRRMIRFLILST